MNRADRVEAVMHVQLLDSGFRIHRSHCANGRTVYYHLTEQYAAYVDRLDQNQVAATLSNGRGDIGCAMTDTNLRKLLRGLACR